MEQEGSGVQQVQAKHPFWGGVLRGLDVAASAIAPPIAAAIPGTSLHHDALINRQEHLANQDLAQEGKEAQTADVQSQIPLREAQAKDAEAQAEERAHPTPKPPTNAFELWAQQNPEAQVKDWIAMQPAANKDENAQLQAEDAWLARPENKGKDRGEAAAWYATLSPQARQEFHIAPSGSEGTWQMAEDDQGKPILYNSKTGETKAAPGNLHPKGSYAKGPGAGEKAMNYANEYLKSGTYTGPGDEALQEQFFSLAKPESGFRMTAPQIAQLQAGRSWMESLEGKTYHALHGTWFTDQQRHQIVQTMNDLAAANKAPSAESAPSGGGSGIKITRDANGRIIGVE
jgi:hypothetical protein